jgi:hypothetical protein
MGTQWEYRVILFRGSETAPEMNELGEAGWELDQIAEADTSHTPVRVLRHPFAVFRRIRDEAPAGAGPAHDQQPAVALRTRGC